MAVIKLTTANFEKEALQSAKPVLVDFYADWCGPCRMVSPLVDELSEESDAFKVVWDFYGSKLEGVGVVAGSNRKVLAIGYILDGQPGVSVMTEAGESAEGVWVTKTSNGIGTETWTQVKGGGQADGAVTYERAVECAAATSFLVGTLRATPGADTARIDAYDKANSAWIIKLGDVGADKPMDQRISDIQAKQAVYAADANGVAVATPVADACVASAPSSG